MIIYRNDKAGFSRDVMLGVIDDKIGQLLIDRIGRRSGFSEVSSWRNSLQFMRNVLECGDISDDIGVFLEYTIASTTKRVDVILTGYDETGTNSAVVVELKQWSDAKPVPGKDSVVTTYTGGSVREVTHPSYQAWSYVAMMEDYNVAVREAPVNMVPCAYLHNYDYKPGDPITESIYCGYVDRSPMFFKHDIEKLGRFIRKHIPKGDNGESMELVDGGTLRPSKSLQNLVSSMIRGNREFVLLDEQKTVYEEVLSLSDRCASDGRKRTLIIRGGPGTGKSVIAISLLAELTNRNRSCCYVTKNSAPREVYRAKLTGTLSRSRADFLFKSSGSFTECTDSLFDVLLADEAHRLNAKSGLFQNIGENQVKEIIASSKLSVFFIDESQRVVVNDIGTESEIERWALSLGSEIHGAELVSQFRCGGSDGYLEWIDDVLGIDDNGTIRVPSDFGYDFRIFDDPNEMRRAIEEYNESDNRSRIVAGYCWNWIKDAKNDSSVHDIVIPGTGFEMSWNLGSSKTWAIDPESVKEAGCIHTCQGLEFDYVGVIIGDDLVMRNGKVCTDRSKKAKTDKALNGLSKRYPDSAEAEKVADRIIRNTYRTLMTRGQKGCFVYCTDKALTDYLKARLSDEYRGQ